MSYALHNHMPIFWTRQFFFLRCKTVRCLLFIWVRKKKQMSDDIKWPLIIDQAYSVCVKAHIFLAVWNSICMWRMLLACYQSLCTITDSWQTQFAGVVTPIKRSQIETYRNNDNLPFCMRVNHHSVWLHLANRLFLLFSLSLSFVVF